MRHSRNIEIRIVVVQFFMGPGELKGGLRVNQLGGIGFIHLTM